MKWFSVKDYLPPKNGRYLAVCKPFKTAVVRYFKNGKWVSWQEVLYWMPLPKIPKESKEEIPPYVRMDVKALPAILNVKYTEEGK